MKASVMCGVVALLMAASASVAQAQIFTPTFMPPRAGAETGIFLSDGPGSFSTEGIWRLAFGGYALGFRGGIADTGGATLLLAGEFRNPLHLAEVPLQVAFTAAVQGALGHASGAGVQGGLTIGQTFEPGDFSVTPYIHPRIAAVNDLGPSDNLNLEVLADVGFEFSFPQNVIFHIGFGLGDPTAGWGVGFSWRQ